MTIEPRSNRLLSLFLCLAWVTPVLGDKHCLWKVSGDNGTSVYLLGSIHFFKEEFYPLPA